MRIYKEKAMINGRCKNRGGAVTFRAKGASVFEISGYAQRFVMTS